MKFSQYTHFIKTKQFAKFREVTDKNDGVMTSSKLRLDVKNDDVISPSKMTESSPNFADVNIMSERSLL